eukprot:scaffold210624_cov17-Prasinocladus_malaysianus.AAC.1
MPWRPQTMAIVPGRPTHCYGAPSRTTSSGWPMYRLNAERQWKGSKCTRNCITLKIVEVCIRFEPLEVTGVCSDHSPQKSRRIQSWRGDLRTERAEGAVDVDPHASPLARQLSQDVRATA